jgi:peptidoglycan/LPS O-acetylase OafA/YrhL
VLLDHWSNYRLGFPASNLGVSLFFVLSGYLITGILLKSKEKDNRNGIGHTKSLKLFYIRRTLRIFPLYYLLLAVLYFINEPGVRDHIFWLASYMTNNYIGYYQHWMGSFDHLWSLAVEEQFYLFFPFVIFFINVKRLPYILVALIALSVLLRAYFFMNGTSWVTPYVLMPTCLDALAMGGLLAYLKDYNSMGLLNIGQLKFGFFISLLVYVIVVFMVKNPDESHNFYSVVLLRFFESCLSVLLIAIFVNPSNTSGLFDQMKKSIFENDVVVFIGKISYGIYIYHHFIYNVYYTSPTNPLSKIFNKLNLLHEGLGENVWIRISIVFPLVILISAISWFLFEKPINQLKEKFKY